MLPGLVSVTFRQLSPAQIVQLCRNNKLRVIEWGGDIHVPHGDTEMAMRVGELTRNHGLEIAAYGSYYRLATSPSSGLEFSAVLASAVALGTKAIRVWAGNRSSANADSAWRREVADDALHCADMAAEKGITLCYEFHDDTLTDTLESASDLLSSTEHPFIKTLWQPPHGRTLEECLTGLRTLAPRLHHIHAFHWWPSPAHRLPLLEGKERWTAYIAELRKLNLSPNILLEFVAGDSSESLTKDAAFLNEMLRA